jgi:electron transport complex protein RnfA
MVLFSGVRSRIEGCEAPKSFEGIPITLIAASIVSLSFFGFTGVIENLFS